MSAFKGTPGPWEFVPESKENEDGEVDMGGFRSASGWVCSFGDGRTYYPSEGTPPELEDARLIAAAPELLSSLEFAVKLLSGLPHVGGTAQLDHMRSVIDKATGGDA